MNTYEVFEHKLLGVKAVKQGFSLGGCFLTLIWLLYHRHWFYASLVFVWGSLIFLIAAKERNFWAVIFLYDMLPMSVIFGVWGNSFLKKHLLKQGYEKTAEVKAVSPEQALAMVTTAKSQPELKDQTSVPDQNLAQSDLATQIGKLNDMFKQGAISEAEFQLAKEKLLK
jgi:hypothetical protein